MDASSSSVPPLSPASQPGKLFVGGISLDTGEELLERYFGAFGEVTEVVVIRDRETGRGKGFAFVQFSEPAAAEAALQVKRHFIGGRTVDVSKAKSRAEHNQRHQYRNQRSDQGSEPNRGSTRNNDDDFKRNNNHVENRNSMAIGAFVNCGHMVPTPSSSIPWRDQFVGALNQNMVPYGDTAAFSRHINAGFDNTTGKTPVGHSRVVNSCENDQKKGEMGRHTTNEQHSLVSNSSESNVNEYETGKQTTDGCILNVDSRENILEDDEDNMKEGDVDNLEKGDTEKWVTPRQC